MLGCHVRALWAVRCRRAAVAALPPPMGLLIASPVARAAPVALAWTLAAALAPLVASVVSQRRVSLKLGSLQSVTGIKKTGLLEVGAFS